MTSGSTPWNERVPFLLTPTGKDYLWGGQRLNDDLSKGIGLDPLAETWECSTHPAGPSVAASGPFAGQTLAEILRERPDLVGTHPKAEGELPVLVKLIDAERDLSVQVHPDDRYARAFEGGQRGKAEFWYVLDAAKGARLVYGLRRDLTAEALRESIRDGTLERHLRYVPARPGDMFYIEAGTIHAIGAGCLIAEVQESSDLTYRLYDYDRTDRYGRRRELHVEKALRVARREASPEPRQPMRKLGYRPGIASELLVRCEHFQVERILLNTERVREMAAFRADHSSFRALLCVRGCGCAFYDGGSGETALRIYRGDCMFVPADSVGFSLHGRMELLDVRG